MDRLSFIRQMGIAGLGWGFTPSSPIFSPEWDLELQEDSILFRAGNYPYIGGVFKTARDITIKVPPPNPGRVESEFLELKPIVPSGYWTGVSLQGMRKDGICGYRSLIAESMDVRERSSGRILVQQVDYLVSAPFALIGLNPASHKRSMEVSVSYTYYRQRLDTIATDGRTLHLLQGEPEMLCPKLPVVPQHLSPVCNVYYPIGFHQLSKDQVFPIRNGCNTDSGHGSHKGVSSFLAGLRGGKEVTIICWGDSITAGADVAKGKSWPDLLEKGIRSRYPDARLKMVNKSIGGTRSMQWVYDGKYGDLPVYPKSECSLDLIVNESPALVVMEFSNDMVEDPSKFEEVYDRIRTRLSEAGSQWIIISPGRFALGTWEENVRDMRKPDERAYVKFLRDYTGKHGIPLADAAKRWENLEQCGIPYLTILGNAYNHPDEKGHLIFYEEIMKIIKANEGIYH